MMSAMPALDHLVYAVPDLDAAVLELAERTGVQPISGGVHPGRGTRNALIGLSWRGSRRSYLEILGPDPEQDVKAGKWMLDLGRLRQREGEDFAPRLYTWAIRPDDMDYSLKRARKRGIDLGKPLGAARDTPTGRRLSWHIAVASPLGFGGVQPFLIEWNGHHPSEESIPTLELLELQFKHPEHEAATAAFRLLGVDMTVKEGKRPRIRATLGTPEGQVILK